MNLFLLYNLLWCTYTAACRFSSVSTSFNKCSKFFFENKSVATFHAYIKSDLLHMPVKMRYGYLVRSTFHIHKRVCVCCMFHKTRIVSCARSKFPFQQPASVWKPPVRAFGRKVGDKEGQWEQQTGKEKKYLQPCCSSMHCSGWSFIPIIFPLTRAA